MHAYNNAQSRKDYVKTLIDRSRLDTMSTAELDGLSDVRSAPDELGFGLRVVETDPFEPAYCTPRLLSAPLLVLL